MDLKFSTKEVAAQPIVGIRTKARPAEIGEAMDGLFAEVFGHIQACGGAPAGRPLSIYHSMQSDSVEFECAIPLLEPAVGTTRVQAGELPSCVAATVTHTGPYENLKETWMALTEWMASQGLEAADAPWEVYVTDPSGEPDRSKWQTQIYFPVRRPSSPGPAQGVQFDSCDA